MTIKKTAITASNDCSILYIKRCRYRCVESVLWQILNIRIPPKRILAEVPTEEPVFIIRVETVPVTVLYHCYLQK